MGKLRIGMAAALALLVLVLPPAAPLPADEGGEPAAREASLLLPMALRDPRNNWGVDVADRWLPSHQASDGHWCFSDFDQWCRGVRTERAPRPSGRGEAGREVGATGFALCAFLGAGYTNRGKHPFARVVSRGLRWLKNQQDADGCFGPRDHPKFLMDHAIATLAMTECYGMTGSPIWGMPARRALRFLVEQRGEDGAWRFRGDAGRDDPMATFWAMMPVKSAELVKKDAAKRQVRDQLSDVDASAVLAGLRPWLDRHTDPLTGRFVPLEAVAAHGDRLPPTAASHAATAAAILARVFLGDDPRKDDNIQRASVFCAKHLPAWKPEGGSMDQTYWYFGTLALFQVGGRPYDAWKKALDVAVVDTQRRRGHFCDQKGSWDPHGPWAKDLGRVYSTCVLAMCLEVFYRYYRVFGAKGGGTAPTMAPALRVGRWQRSALPDHVGRIHLTGGGFLPIESERIAVEIHGVRARVVLDLFVRNDREEAQEGQFQLRLPEGAVPYYLAFGDLTATVAPAFQPAAAVRTSAAALHGASSGDWGRTREARMVPTVRGGEAYRRVVQRDRIKDPALLQWAGAGVFDVRVFPLIAKRLHRIVLGYEIDLTPNGHDFEYRLDLPVDVEDVEVALAVRGSDAEVTPAAEIRDGVRHWRNPQERSIRARMVTPGAVLLESRDPAKRDHFALWARADLPQAQPRTPRPRAVFLLDVSRSSGRGAFPVWLKLLETVLELNRLSLREFAVGFFDIHTRWWRAGFVENTPENAAAVLAYARQLDLEGATDVEAALRSASRKQGSFDLFLLSDGASNWAPRSLERLGPALGPDRPVFAYTTGIPGVDRRLLDHLTRETGGALYSVPGDSDVPSAALAHRLSPWTLVDVTVPGGEDVLVSGRPAALYAGQRLRIAGRGRVALDAPVTLTVARDGATQRVDLSVDRRVESDMAADVYGEIAVTQLEAFEHAAATLADAYASHYRVVGRTCSLLMLETEAEYVRFGLLAQRYADEIARRPVRPVLAELEERASSSGSARARLLALLGSIAAEQSGPYEVPARLLEVIESLSERALEVEPTPLDRGWRTEALRTFSALREEKPGSVAVARELAQITRAAGHPTHAYQFLLEVARLRPLNPIGFWNLASCAEEAGRAELALIWYEVALAGRWWGDIGRIDVLADDYIRFLRSLLRDASAGALTDFARVRLGGLGVDEDDPLEADLVVILDWTTERTNLDLHVTNPEGWTVRVDRGGDPDAGHFSPDIVSGFGPEMFVLKRAAPGAYTIHVRREAADEPRAPARTRAQVRVVRDWGRTTERTSVHSVLFTEPEGRARVTVVGR